MKPINQIKPRIKYSLASLIVHLYSSKVLAAQAQGLPWETPLETIARSLTGPVAATISTLAFFAALASLAFGQDLSGFVRTLVIITMVVAGLLSINSVISIFSSAQGATLMGV